MSSPGLVIVASGRLLPTTSCPPTRSCARDRLRNGAGRAPAACRFRPRPFDYQVGHGPGQPSEGRGDRPTADRKGENDMPTVDAISASPFLGRAPDDGVVQTAIGTRVPPLFDYLESQLGSGDVLAGSGFSIGDIAIATHFVNARYAGFRVDARRWPELARYVGRILARASFRTLIEEEESMLGQAA